MRPFIPDQAADVSPSWLIEGGILANPGLRSLFVDVTGHEMAQLSELCYSSAEAPSYWEFLLLLSHSSLIRDGEVRS